MPEVMQSYLVSCVPIFWQHMLDEPINFIVMLATVAGAAIALFYSIKANRKAKEANKLAEAANQLSSSANKVTERLARHQIINDLFREYRQPDMAKSVRAMWELNSHRSLPPESVAQFYLLAQEQERKENREGEMDAHRRKVTQFYVQLSVESYADHMFRDVLYSIWFKEDLAIIKYVLLPIDEIVMQHKKVMPDFDQMHPQNQKLFQLWDKAPVHGVKL